MIEIFPHSLLTHLRFGKNCIISISNVWNSSRLDQSPAGLLCLPKRGLNYHIHTDAIQQYLIDEELSPQDRQLMFSSEADLLNLALFGKKAWEWRQMHQDESKKGENIRDYASAEELVVLINLESLNSELIKEGLNYEERYSKLRTIAKQQMDILIKNHAKRSLKKANPNLLKGGESSAD